MMIIHGYELIGDWENSTSGKIATALKGGKKYFLKKYQTPVAPIDNGTLDAKTFANNKKLFLDFVTLRKTVNQRIRPIAGAGGNIIIPCEEFIDGNQYVEASEFIDGAIPKKDMVGVIAGLDHSAKELLMKTAAGALASVHSRGVIHSDLKLENLLLVRNSAKNFVAKIVDFDNSYTVDKKPEEIIGTIDYYSPELGRCFESEDEDDGLRQYITEKTDIFSLGLIYHFYLAGDFPEAVNLTEKLKKRKEKGKVIYPWVALNSGCALAISPKITSAKYISLISDMLSVDFNNRPTAQEVLKRLQMPDTSLSAPVIDEPFAEHGIVFDKYAIISAGILKIEGVAFNSQNQYRVLFRNGVKCVLTKEEMVSSGYAKVSAPKEFQEPWAEHNIEFDIDMLRSRGFVASKNEIRGGIKAYKLYRNDTDFTFFRAEMLLAMKYARERETVSRVESVTDTPKGSTSSLPEPWHEHSIAFVPEVITAKGYVAAAKKTMNGINGYEFIRTDGTRQFIRVEMLIVQKMARRI